MTPSSRKQSFNSSLDHLFGLTSLVALILLIIRFGFPLSQDFSQKITTATEVVLLTFIVQELARLLANGRPLKPYLYLRKIELLMTGFAGLYFIKISAITEFIQWLAPGAGIEQISLAYLGIAQILLILMTIAGKLKGLQLFKKLSTDPSKILIISFLLGATVGTLLLKLPNATVDTISWVDAGFTAVSSICVTGLLPFNLAETFTPLGQFFILCLIQIGGLGIMTLTMVFLTLFPGSLSVKERIFLSELVSDNRLGEVGRILKRIIVATIVIESLGAIYLYQLSYGWQNGFSINNFYQCIFHSISAFCNAGMTLFTAGSDLLGSNGFTFGLALLIMLGGIGFPVISELYSYAKDFLRKPRRRNLLQLSLTTKLVLMLSLCLWLGGTVLAVLLESNHSFKGLSGVDRWFHGFFFAVTTRTAGFSSWPLEQIDGSTMILLMVLMWIGASPVSTGGGFKTINFGVIVLSLWSHIRGIGRIDIFRRQISLSSTLRSFNIVTATMLTSALAMIVLFYLEPQINPLYLAFEAVSALSTVGLSVGVTEQLSTASKLLIIALMFIGRIGVYTFFLGLMKKKLVSKYRFLPEDLQTH